MGIFTDDVIGIPHRLNAGLVYMIPIFRHRFKYTVTDQPVFFMKAVLLPAGKEVILSESRIFEEYKKADHEQFHEGDDDPHVQVQEFLDRNSRKTSALKEFLQ